MAQAAPRALLVSYSFTGQSARLLRAAGDELLRHGWDVVPAEIELTDRRFAPRLAHFPLRRVWPDMMSLLPAQVRGSVGDIALPPEVFDGDYDLICIGSPTWWGRASLPVRSFLASPQGREVLSGRRFAVFIACRDSWRGNLAEVARLAEWQGGRFAGEMHATYPGNQITSTLSLTSYLGTGEQRDRYLGIPIPPTNVQQEHLDSARELAAAIGSTSPGGQ
ncbi:flavodoxin family protein [Tsukamurella strandjordii]|uniref:flavodoxin family protein n=1 Tax=Tsukamurella TaxID=2060 RepID=UPI001C7D508B|nr:flavodoxin family protein [Tsukamurella sp. TY48]GIZ99319.1 hypothetical protein TTY48_39310 [Tsukamurella sp. TY48]